MKKRAGFSIGTTPFMLRQWGMALALFAMLVNALASFTCSYRLPGAGESDPIDAAAVEAAAALGQPLVICTPAGLRVIGADGSSTPAAPDDSSSPLCGYCLLQAVAATLPSAVVGDGVYLPRRLAARPVIPQVSRPRVATYLSDTSPRAPPVAV